MISFTTSYSQSQEPTCVSNINFFFFLDSSPLEYYALPWECTRNIRKMTQRKITEELKYQLYRFKKFKYRFILVH
jgi:hypothetical protein